MLDIATVRAQFPSLERTGLIHLDNPGGTQIAQPALDRITHYLLNTNANHGGVFQTSIDSDHLQDNARVAMQTLLGAAMPQEIIFGPNMTTLTLHLSRSIAPLLNAGDEIILTRLDHDANVAPWLRIAEDRSCRVQFIDFDPEDCTLRLNQLASALSSRTKLVALGYASNAVGTINDVAQAVRMAQQVGALTFIDAVQFAAHGVIDVQALGCDFLACSSYKFFGPHAGILYGRYQLLDRLNAYKVRTSSATPPGKWETGTPNFEGIAGVLGAVEYLAWVGQQFGTDITAKSPLRDQLVQGLTAIHTYEEKLSWALINGLSAIPHVRVFGLTNPDQMHQRVSTVSFRLDGYSPQDVALALAREHIAVWHGNFYALEVTRRLEVEDSGGLVRVGAVHYNTLADIERVVEVVNRLAHG